MPRLIGFFQTRLASACGTRSPDQLRGPCWIERQHLTSALAWDRRSQQSSSSPQPSCSAPRSRHAARILPGQGEVLCVTTSSPLPYETIQADSSSSRGQLDRTVGFTCPRHARNDGRAAATAAQTTIEVGLPECAACLRAGGRTGRPGCCVPASVEEFAVFYVPKPSADGQRVMPPGGWVTAEYSMLPGSTTQ